MWKQYKRKGLSEMRPYILNEDISGISVSDADKDAGSPKEGDMIARNPKNHEDQWLVAKKYFEDNLELAEIRMSIITVNGYEIAGNAFIAIVIKIGDPADFEYFTRDPEGYNNAFEHAIAWTSDGG